MPVTAALFALVLQLTLDGKPLAGGEVCWFGAGSPADPVARFTSFAESRPAATPGGQP
ncbi:MAG TPA: hypothetical protein VGJ81_19170 [Thermoanaerobaculia bacterium]|jgi:hypothetical protein